VAIGVRELDGDEGDAVVRTLVQSLRDEVRPFLHQDQVIATTTATRITIGREFVYDVTSVDAVYDLTADPNELSPLAGVFTAGDVEAVPPVAATFAPTVAFTVGHRVRLEASYRPHVVAQAHQDLVQIERLPAVYVGLGSNGTVEPGQGKRWCVT
jgi:hypothetical protein